MITTGTAFVVYMLTLAPDLSWANHSVDGGELITAAATLGVPHPSGYPTYVLLGKLFTWLPIGTLAYRLNFFSAVSVALAAGLVGLMGVHLIEHYFPALPNRPAKLVGVWPEVTAVAAGLTFAFAPLIWGQALVSEVYGLNLLCLAALLWALLTQRPSWLVGLLFGLSLTTHLTSLLLLPLTLIWLGRQQIGKFFLGVLIGLLPFLFLPLLTNSGSPVVWGQADNLAGWWWLVSGQLYRNNLFNFAAFAVEERLTSWAILLPAQFLWIGFVLLMWGVWQAARTTVDSRFRLWAGLTSGTAVLYLIYAFGYGTPDAVVFTLPALLLCAMLLAPALKAWGWLALGLPLFLLLLNFQTQDLSGQDGLRPLTLDLLGQLPAEAVVLSENASTTFTLWYFHFAEKKRPDLVIVDTNLFAFDWYRNRLRAREAIFVPAVDDLPSFYETHEGQRPLCFVKVQPETNPPFLNSCHEQE